MKGILPHPSPLPLFFRSFRLRDFARLPRSRKEITATQAMSSCICRSTCIKFRKPKLESEQSAWKISHWKFTFHSLFASTVVCDNGGSVVIHSQPPSFDPYTPDHVQESTACVRRTSCSHQWNCRLKDCKPNGKSN